MNIFHKLTPNSNKIDINQQMIQLPHRQRPNTSHSKYSKQSQRTISLANATVISQMKKISMSSLTKQSGETERSKIIIGGYKYNRKKVVAFNHLSRYYHNRRDSLYDKSINKAKSRIQRKDFQQSVKDITNKKFLTTKKSKLNQNQLSLKRYKTQMNPPQSTTIIIQLKKIFNNKGEYHFVQNNQEITDNYKRDEQIFSTTHTNYESQRRFGWTHNVHQASNRKIYDGYTHNLHQRAKSAKHGHGFSLKRSKILKKDQAKIVESELIPWLKESQIINVQNQFGFTDSFL